MFTSFARAARALRKKSTDRDIYEPGDPLLDEFRTLVGRLRAGIPSHTAPAAFESLQRLEIAAFSRPRVWLRAPDQASVQAVGKAPGAAYAPYAAVQRLQKSDPLYCVYADTLPPGADVHWLIEQ